jgi:hypothetical protein
MIGGQPRHNQWFGHSGGYMPTEIQQLPLWIQIALAVVPAISATLAALALLLNWQQARRTNSQSRAALVSGCLKDFSSDGEMQRAFYAIEYSEFKYDGEFHQSPHEKEYDKLFRHFSNLALAWQSGLLSTKDVLPIQYYVLRILRNPEVVKYLKFVEEWSRSEGLRDHPYAVLVRMGEALSAKKAGPNQAPQQTGHATGGPPSSTAPPA